jgi:small conductance mechanosensitive channel
LRYDRRVSDPLRTLLDTPDAATQIAVQYGPRIASAVLILVIGYFAMRWAAGLAGRGLDKFKLEPPVRQLLLRIVRVFVLLLFLMMALQNLGIDLLPLIAGLGIAGAGIALALQGVLGNLAAGLTIIFTKPFRVGEYISIAGEEGQVQDISLFNTVLRHSDLSSVVIPNRKIAGEILHNYGEVRQLDLRVAVAYGSNLEAVVATVREVLAANPRILRDPAPLVQADVLGEYAVNIAIKPWVAVKDYGAAPGELNPAILDALRRQAVEIPVPIVRTIVTQAG